MTIGQKIKILRKSKGISQEQLAIELKINRNFLSRIETEKSEPTASILKNLAKIFNISIDSLLEINESKIKSEEKIKTIKEKCTNLTDKDLDFILRTISIMHEEYVKNNINIEEK